MYFIGFGLTGKCTILYVYVTELMPVSKRNLYATLLNSFDGGTMIWSSLYFAYIPYWKPFFIFVLAMHAAVLGCLLFFPESPIVLYENGRYEEARSVYAYIARSNGVKDFKEDFSFDKEVKSIDRTPKPLNKTENGSENAALDELEFVEEKVTLRTLVQNRAYLINLIVMTVLWTASSFDYYLINF
jgi:hypothetical protein